MFPRSYSCSLRREFPVILRLKRQQHSRKSPPKTFSVSLQVKYIARTNAQLKLTRCRTRSLLPSQLYLLCRLSHSLHSHMFAKGRTRRGGSRRSFLNSCLVRIGLNAASQPVHARSPG